MIIACQQSSNEGEQAEQRTSKSGAGPIFMLVIVSVGGAATRDSASIVLLLDKSSHTVIATFEVEGFLGRLVLLDVLLKVLDPARLAAE